MKQEDKPMTGLPKTTKLKDSLADVLINNSAANPSIDIGSIRPWRIALVLKKRNVTLVVDTIQPIVLGRSSESNGEDLFIDLRIFGAEEAGVSRRHLCLQLQGSHISVCDLKSSNGTWLNSFSLKANIEYPIRHMDELKLGNFEVQILLLTDPLR